MTAFTSSNLPSSVTTVEEVAAWALLVLRETAPTQAISEALNTVNFQVDIVESVNPDGKQVFIGRCVFEQLPVGSVTGKKWNSIVSIPRSAEIPTYYTSN